MNGAEKTPAFFTVAPGERLHCTSAPTDRYLISRRVCSRHKAFPEPLAKNNNIWAQKTKPDHSPRRLFVQEKKHPSPEPFATRGGSRGSIWLVDSPPLSPCREHEMSTPPPPTPVNTIHWPNVGASVADAGQTLSQHWVSVSCRLGQCSLNFVSTVL